jgi:hypothetical protein
VSESDTPLQAAYHLDLDDRGSDTRGSCLRQFGGGGERSTRPQWIGNLVVPAAEERNVDVLTDLAIVEDRAVVGLQLYRVWRGAPCEVRRARFVSGSGCGYGIGTMFPSNAVFHTASVL